MMAGWAVNRVLTGVMLVEVDPNFRYDITRAAEGAGRVINVAKEGVGRGWNVEWNGLLQVGSAYRFYHTRCGVFIHQW